MPNCKNCGGPLPDELINGRFTCEFCSTINEPQLTCEDIVDLGRDAGIDCPVCGMGLTSGLIDGEKIAWCQHCQGMMFNDMSFATTVRMRRSRYGAYGEPPRPLNPAALDRKLKCSRCRKPMQVHPFHGPGNVVIDSCYPCGLIWVDAGEMTQIEQAPGRR